MPAAAVYVIAIVGTVAAGVAFKEFIYDPHIAPKFDQWLHEFAARREARRRRRTPVAVPASPTAERRRNDSDDDTDTHSNAARDFEMETFRNRPDSAVSSEQGGVSVLQWRSGVESATVRKRKVKLSTTATAGLTSSSTVQLQEPLIPTQPQAPTLPPVVSMDTHIFTDTDTDTETEADSILASSTTHHFQGDPIDHRLSSLSSLGALNNLATPTASNPFADPLVPLSNTSTLSPRPSIGTAHDLLYNSPSLVPSLSLSHPVPRADIEDGVELLDYTSSTSTSRRISPIPSGSPISELSSFTASVSDAEARSERSDFEVLSPLQMPTVMSIDSGATMSMPTAIVSGAINRGTPRGAGSEYLTRNQIQHLIDQSSQSSAPAALLSPAPVPAPPRHQDMSASMISGTSSYASFSPSPSPSPSPSLPTRSAYFSPFASVAASPASSPRANMVNPNPHAFIVQSDSSDASSVSESDISSISGISGTDEEEFERARRVG